ncbi:armadillo-type protein [Catenaria anguillulae PL171]|uniref:Exportin-T n=1 Tax=Catenaria anguillulae PL171 TaxID=765915 RepID=A0A1Y2HMV8_9FUNG|nr:armadillo-type protein [Catenaria anguillulae PL171]
MTMTGDPSAPAAAAAAASADGSPLLAQLAASLDPHLLQTVRQAIQAAMAPSGLVDQQTHHQANQYLDQLRSQPNAWQLCLSLAAAEDMVRNPYLVFYALQSLELLLPSLDTAAVLASAVRPAVWALLRRSLSTPGTEPFLRNKIAQLVTLLFARLWPAEWPEFWDQVWMLLPKLDPATGAFAAGVDLNAARPAVDFFLRLTHAIDQEIVNVLIHREANEVSHNQILKDHMREGTVQQLVQLWYTIAHAYAHDEQVVVQCLKNASLYISWIDVSLIVNDRWLPLILRHLNETEHAARLAALECLSEIVSKGMKPAEKLRLIEYLGVFQLLQQFVARFFPTTQLQDEDDDLAFVEQVGKLVSVVGVQLAEAWVNAPKDDQALLATLTSALHTLFPIYLQFFADDWDHVHATVTDLTTHWLNYWKLLKKAQFGLPFTAQHAELGMAQQLLHATVRKLAYHADQAMPVSAVGALVGDGSADSEADEDDDAIAFAEQRRNLKVVFDNLAQLVPEVWAAYVVAVISDTLSKYKSAASVSAAAALVPWTEAELALHLIYLFGEAIKCAAKAKEDKTLTAYRDPKSNAVTPLGSLMVQLLESGIAAYPAACIPPLYWEVVVRYSGFFAAFAEYLPSALDALARGMHVAGPASERAAYLMLRFIKDTRTGFDKTVIEGVLASMADLLGVPGAPAPGTDPEAVAKCKEDVYEAVSLLVAHDALPPAKRAEYLRAALGPLMQALQAATANVAQVRGTGDREALGVHVAGVMYATGALAKEFPTASTTTPTTTSAMSTTAAGNAASEADRPWIPILADANQVVLAALDAFAYSSPVRAAARACFQRSLKAMGPRAFPLLPPLLSTLLANVSVHEAGDLLGFLGLLIYQHRTALAGFIDDLIRPVFAMVARFLSVPPQGTDEAVAMVNIKKMYLSFLGSLVTPEHGLTLVLVSEANFAALNEAGVLGGVAGWAMAGTGVEGGDRAVQKTAVGLLGKFAIAWSKSPLPPHVPPTWLAESLLPHIARVCFEMPLKCCDPKDAGTLVVVNEIAALHKQVFDAQGNQWPQFLAGVYLPAVGCPPDMANEYAQAVASLETRKLAAWLKGFISANR